MKAQPAVPRTKRGALVVLGLTLVAAFAAILLLLEVTEDILEDVADHGGIAVWDRPVLDWMIAHRTPSATGFLSFLSNVGGPIGAPVVTAVVVLFLWWRWKDVTPVVLTAIALGGSLAMSVLGKRAVARMRPPIEDAIPPYETSFAWPSGHTLNATVFAGVLAYLVIRHLWDHPRWQRLLVAALALAYAAAMGVSRLYLGHHWLTDVAGAVALGLAWLALVIAVHRVWRTVRHREEHQPIEEERKDAPAS